MTTDYKISNINFWIEENEVYFQFMHANGLEGAAYLKLPDAPSSQDLIDGSHYYDFEEDDEDRENQKKWSAIFDQLLDFFFDSFNDTDCAIASVLLARRVECVESIVPENLNGELFVAFFEDYEGDHDRCEIIKRSDHKDCYTMTSLDETEKYMLIERAISERV